jgi:hypothetical protein
MCPVSPHMFRSLKADHPQGRMFLCTASCLPCCCSSAQLYPGMWLCVLCLRTTYFLTYLFIYLLTYFLTYLVTYLRTYLLTYLRTYLLTYVLPYLLTYSMEHSPSWEANRFSASQENSAFYGTRRFITAFTSARHLSLTWASSIQFLLPHPTFWRSNLILSFYLRLGLPCYLFP